MAGMFPGCGGSCSLVKSATSEFPRRVDYLQMLQFEPGERNLYLGLREPIRFGIFEMDLTSGELRKQGVRIKLQEQPFQVLVALVERPGEVVSREELQKRLWSSDVVVDFDRGLNKAINRLREALGDDADAPRFIETLPQRGYRFLAEVESAASAARPKSVPIAEPRFRHIGRRGLLAMASGLTAAPLLIYGYRRFVSGPPQIESIAVLPLENLSGNIDQEYFSDGMTDELIGELARIGSLRVISRTSIMQYKVRRRKSLQEIARELNVDAILEGTVAQSGGRVRITAQLYAPWMIGTCGRNATSEISRISWHYKVKWRAPSLIRLKSG